MELTALRQRRPGEKKIASFRQTASGNDDRP